MTILPEASVIAEVRIADTPRGAGLPRVKRGPSRPATQSRGAVAIASTGMGVIRFSAGSRLLWVYVIMGATVALLLWAEVALGVMHHA